jgi:hypothetical protein
MARPLLVDEGLSLSSNQVTQDFANDAVTDSEAGSDSEALQ